jgi:glycosyltransferase involved in cell wall biosynthesis
MNATEIKISIILPVYNVEKYIDRAILSLVSQSFGDYEIILCNDGSKDSSGKKCDEWAEKESRIKVIHKENGGVASARNAALQIAEGEYIYFMDPDDYVVGELLCENYALAKETDADQVIFGFVSEVLDKDESHMGILYFDFHPRAGKGQGAWCGYYREQRYETDGSRTAPVVGIVCNFTRPTSSTPSLLTLDEVTTLFHEFGHALHFLFTDVRYNGLIGVEGDFVELPSQIMENWALTPEMLRTYATHYRTGEVIRDQYITRIQNSSLFNQGFNTTELIAAALSDMDIHSIENYTPIDVDGFEYNALYQSRAMLPQIEPRYKYPYFAHIFSGGYSAGYYFYIWAEVLDKDAFEAFRETGDLFDRRTADALRREILSKGGSRDGMSLYKAFRGQAPDKSAMLKARGLWKEPEVDSTQMVVKPTITDMLKMKKLN